MSNAAHSSWKACRQSPIQDAHARVSVFHVEIPGVGFDCWTGKRFNMVFVASPRNQMLGFPCADVNHWFSMGSESKRCWVKQGQ